MSKNKSIIFKGNHGFSRSKLEQLTQHFNKVNQTKTNISCNEIYLVQVESDDIDVDGLKDILSADEFQNDFSFYVGPRLGTISPWSSKTEDIIKNVGFKNIKRVERLYGFKLDQLLEHSHDFSMFYDRMTQEVYKSKDDFQHLFVSDAPRPLNYVDILKNGKQALEHANTTFGFAMSSEEIDYLFNFYKKENRNPTDAELMMFAQANSEHCRHKIFNAKWDIDGNQMNNSLFDLIKDTSKASPDGIISAYKDNAAIIEGEKIERLHLNEANTYELKQDIINSTIKVETHNHPTAISPYPGASIIISYDVLILEGYEEEFISHFFLYLGIFKFDKV